MNGWMAGEGKKQFLGRWTDRVKIAMKCYLYFYFRIFVFGAISINVLMESFTSGWDIFRILARLTPVYYCLPTFQAIHYIIIFNLLVYITINLITPNFRLNTIQTYFSLTLQANSSAPSWQLGDFPSFWDSGTWILPSGSYTFPLESLNRWEKRRHNYLIKTLARNWSLLFIVH